MFRSRLKELMEQKELTAAQVAAASGLSPDTIKVLCRDLVSGSTRLSTVECLAEALGISLCELVEHTSSRSAKRRSKQEEYEQ
jgi:transcriptional regulator with XRE-family HTH domain